MAHSPDHGDETTFTVHRDEFRAVLGSRFQRLVLMQTNAHEGPVYVAAEHALYFTTVPEPGPRNIFIKRLQLAGEQFPFQAQEQAERTIGLLSIASLYLIFSILYSRYRSVVLSVIIIGSVLLALIGSATALWLAGQLCVPKTRSISVS